MSFRINKNKNQRRRSSLGSDFTDSSEGTTLPRARRDTVIGRFPSALIPSAMITDDNTFALDPRREGIQTYLVRTDNRPIVMVEVTRNVREKEKADLQAIALVQDIETLTEANENDGIPDITEFVIRHGPDMEGDATEMLNAALAMINDNRTEGVLVIVGGLEKIDLGEGNQGIRVNLAVRETGEGEVAEQETRLVAESLRRSQPLERDNTGGPVSTTTTTSQPVPDARNQEAQRREGPEIPVSLVSPRAAITSPRQRILPPSGPVPQKIPSTSIPSIFNPDKFRQMMDFGRLTRPSPQLRALITELSTYQKALQTLRDRALIKGEVTSRDVEEAIEEIRAKQEELTQRINLYNQKTESNRKRAIVRQLLEEIARPNSAEHHVSESLSGLIPANVATSIIRLPGNTASEVFSTTTSRLINGANTKEGFAKAKLSPEDNVGSTMFALLSSFSKNFTDLATELGLAENYKMKLVFDGLGGLGSTPMTKPPSLLARQVISSRLDQALGILVLSSEEFMLDEGDNLWAVSAKVGGRPAGDDRIPPEGEKIYRRLFVRLENSNLQRGLSNLQIMDALTGQMDRHSGNIYIDENGNVKGIDNDMAFFAKNDGESSSWIKGQFERISGRLVYTQKQIDQATGEKILAMTEEEFFQIIRGKDTDPERIGEEDDRPIMAALERFRAVKARVQELKDQGKLISNWDGRTMLAAISDNELVNGNPDLPTNYMAMLKVGMERAAKQDNLIL